MGLVAMRSKNSLTSCERDQCYPRRSVSNAYLLWKGRRVCVHVDILGPAHFRHLLRVDPVRYVNEDTSD